MAIKTHSLQPNTLAIIQDKHTEHPYTGEYNDFQGPGTYLCRQCGLALFRASTKFHSGCGWPSFDEEIAGSVNRIKDADGQRIEILCSRCSGHLGHVFQGEGFTEKKNTRHCVNSLSLEYVFDENVLDTEEAIFAGGCFWGVEALFQKLPGVLKTEVGYTGGKKEYPTYHEVCDGNTGHYEAMRVLYDPSKISYEKIAKYFFEIHDPTQNNGQGPDIGQQYQSAVFYFDEEQKKIAMQLIKILEEKGYRVATRLFPVTIFWPAEEYHQNYYSKTGKSAYCHRHENRF